MSSLSDGFLTLPGGYGTLEEFFETLTWAQLGLHTKPCALLDVAGFWDDLLAMVDTQIGEGFARDEHRQLILSGEDPDELLDRMAAYIPPGSIDPVPDLFARRTARPSRSRARTGSGRDLPPRGATGRPVRRWESATAHASVSEGTGGSVVLTVARRARLFLRALPRRRSSDCAACGTPGRDRSYTLRSNRNLPSDNRATIEANACGNY